MHQILALTLASFMLADAPKPPVVSDRARGDFFKAQARLLRANAEQKAAQDDFSAVVDKMCNNESQLQLDGQGEPICTAKIPVVNKSPLPPAQVPASHAADKNAQHPKG